ncbi:ATP-dependent helicase [Acetobacterium fimetarium]|uniref:ATP-dependent helicase n=1 Tax=Acetobacterium fimetarium TaxID=52691 RepID=A0ABR6WQR7_9FIRM|nr:DEAD/DEAH box helicase [Acetobacterium fimetarium]MBC3802925.1 ATP-dependent helicase [Acetobacterium fimetarium]
MTDYTELIASFTKDDFILDYEPVAKKGFTEEKRNFEQAWQAQFRAHKDQTLFYFGFQDELDFLSPTMAFLHRITTEFVRKIAAQPDLEISRENTDLSVSADEIAEIRKIIPFGNGMAHVNDGWLVGIWERLTHVYQEAIKAYPGTVAAFLTEHHAGINVAGRIFFHLVENSEDERYPFAFLATYATKPEDGKKALHTPLKNALREYQNQPEKLIQLLSTVSRAADSSGFISELMESGELFSPLRLTARDATVFLTEIPLYEEAGIMCRIPNWWRRKTNQLRLNLTVGEKEPAKVGMDAILSFKPSLFFGDAAISKEEIQGLLAETQGLALIKGKWVEIDHQQLQAALAALSKAEALADRQELTLAQAMRLELGSQELLGIPTTGLEVHVSTGDWLRHVKETMANPETLRGHKPVPSFHGELRPYQQTGYDWLKYMVDLRLGACLADDMGLGKTVEIIALLEHLRSRQGGRVLLILPASLIGNWQKEIAKFAPSMPVGVLHGPAAAKHPQALLADPVFLTITTYGMAVRLAELGAISWDLIILDEAQAIKNPGTKRTKTIKGLTAKTRIAMTGTPIENHLSDLWSLFDFLDGGLLGSAKAFTGFTKGLKKDPGGYTKLRNLVNPFILRRLKTDESIISDLPDKIEIKEYPLLSKKQMVLYQNLVKELAQKIEETVGIARKGLVLASIIKLKQICNHPDQYLGQDLYKPDHSGKFEMLASICETIYEKRERVLVFTQFKEMTEPLSRFLEAIFHRPGLVLHGGTPVAKRTELVETFNGEAYIPFMVLSLKAGGVGLNLTGANNVIHFDRWWNPAVENQATDRAFRIGQTRDVMVHKFITAGTIEEKIDAMIEEKNQLAGDIIKASGESWITELDNQQLLKLLSLGGI